MDNIKNKTRCWNQESIIHMVAVWDKSRLNQKSELKGKCQFHTVILHATQRFESRRLLMTSLILNLSCYIAHNFAVNALPKSKEKVLLSKLKRKTTKNIMKKRLKYLWLTSIPCFAKSHF